MEPPLNPLALLRPRRKIVGQSAVLLPLDETGSIIWPEFRAHVSRTAAAGLTPAVNMDTGYVHLLDEPTRRRVLAETRAVLGRAAFVAGAFVSDQPGDLLNRDNYRREIDAIQQHGGTPVVFPSFGLTALESSELLDFYQMIARDCPRYIAFELGTQFAPFGRIYDLETYAGLLGISACIGAKHSSLDRVQEWNRLILRDRLRPDFQVLTGNDLAIDMVMYGSDYLLGLSTFAPDLFARRDRLWETGDPGFFELNDVLQYLGFLAFRPPVPGYKHSAAQFLQLRGWFSTSCTHRLSPARPASDRLLLGDVVQRLMRCSSAS